MSLPKPYYQSERVTLYHGDCLELLKHLEGYDVIVADPPYGMKKAEWDTHIPTWLPLVGDRPVACFCGVIGMRDYPTPAWCGAWVRLASTQRIGKLGGFNNWEPILFYNVKRLANDTLSEPNLHDDTGHPTTKPTRLMVRLVDLMPEGVVLDPFAGSGTTGIACIRLGRRFIGIEREEKWCEVAADRLRAEESQGALFGSPKAAAAMAFDLFSGGGDA